MIKIRSEYQRLFNKKNQDPMDSVVVKTHRKWQHRTEQGCTSQPAHIHTDPVLPGEQLGCRTGVGGEGEAVVRCQIKCHLLLCQWSNSLLKAWPFDPGGARPIAQCSHEVITNDSSEGGWRGVHGVQCWTHLGPVLPKRGCVWINYKPLTLSESLILQFG